MKRPRIVAFLMATLLNIGVAFAGDDDFAPTLPDDAPTAQSGESTTKRAEAYSNGGGARAKAKAKAEAHVTVAPTVVERHTREIIREVPGPTRIVKVPGKTRYVRVPGKTRTVYVPVKPKPAPKPVAKKPARRKLCKKPVVPAVPACTNPVVSINSVKPGAPVIPAEVFTRFRDHDGKITDLRKDVGDLQSGQRRLEDKIDAQGQQLGQVARDVEELKKRLPATQPPAGTSTPDTTPTAQAPEAPSKEPPIDLDKQPKGPDGDSGQTPPRGDHPVVAWLKWAGGVIWDVLWKLILLIILLVAAWFGGPILWGLVKKGGNKLWGRIKNLRQDLIQKVNASDESVEEPQANKGHQIDKAPAHADGSEFDLDWRPDELSGGAPDAIEAEIVGKAAGLEQSEPAVIDADATVAREEIPAQLSAREAAVAEELEITLRGETPTSGLTEAQRRSIRSQSGHLLGPTEEEAAAGEPAPTRLPSADEFLSDEADSGLQIPAEVNEAATAAGEAETTPLPETGTLFPKTPTGAAGSTPVSEGGKPAARSRARRKSAADTTEDVSAPGAEGTGAAAAKPGRAPRAPRPKKNATNTPAAADVAKGGDNT